MIYLKKNLRSMDSSIFSKISERGVSGVQMLGESRKQHARPQPHRHRHISYVLCWAERDGFTMWFSKLEIAHLDCDNIQKLHLIQSSASVNPQIYVYTPKFIIFWIYMHYNINHRLLIMICATQFRKIIKSIIILLILIIIS